jgi:hypothetical protein
MILETEAGGPMAAQKDQYSHTLVAFKASSLVETMFIPSDWVSGMFLSVL